VAYPDKAKGYVERGGGAERELAIHSKGHVAIRVNSLFISCILLRSHMLHRFVGIVLHMLFSLQVSLVVSS
jgi:hypothetical protein